MKKKLFCWLAFVFWGGPFQGWAISEDEGLFLTLDRKAQSADRLPTQRTVITREDILQSGAHNLGEALSLVPGALLNRTGTVGAMTTLRLRGVPKSNQVQVLIDDQPLGGSAVQSVDLSQISVDNIERIEIIRGGASSLYGANAMGGIVHVVTRRHRQPGTSTNLGFSIGSFGFRSHQGDIGFAQGPVDGFVSVARQRASGFQDNSDLDGINVSGQGGFRFRGGGALSLALDRTDTEIGTPSGTPVPLGRWNGKRERRAIDPTVRVDQKKTRGRLKLTVPFGASVVLENSFHASQSSYRNFGGSFPFDSDIRIQGLDLKVRTDFGTVLGQSYERDFQGASGQPRVHVINEAFYVQQDVHLGRLFFSPAFRVDQHSTFGNAYNPRVGMVWGMTPGLKLSATAARSFRAPTFLDLYYPGYSNPDLKPETAWSYDVGTEIHRGDALNFRVTGFYTKLRDRIVFDEKPVNRPQAEISGLEIEAFYRFRFFQERWSYAYTRALGNSINASKNETLAYNPRHGAAQELTFFLPGRWQIRHALRYVHRQFEREGEKGVRLPSFTRWDLGVSKKVLNTEFTAALDNVTNKYYAETVSRGQPVPLGGLTFRLGVEMGFAN